MEYRFFKNKHDKIHYSLLISKDVCEEFLNRNLQRFYGLWNYALVLVEMAVEEKLATGVC